MCRNLCYKCTYHNLVAFVFTIVGIVTFELLLVLSKSLASLIIPLLDYLVMQSANNTVLWESSTLSTHEQVLLATIISTAIILCVSVNLLIQYTRR